MWYEGVTIGPGMGVCMELHRKPRRHGMPGTERHSRKRAHYGQRGMYCGLLHLIQFDSKIGYRWGKAREKTGKVGKGHMLAILVARLTHLGFTHQINGQL